MNKFVSDDVKLDYSDVLIVPGKSHLESRSQVVLDEVPIIAANMDGVGTFAMARKLSEFGIKTALVKHYTLEQLLDFYREDGYLAGHTYYSTGIGQTDLDKLHAFMAHVDYYYTKEESKVFPPAGICVDVANGYSTKFVDTIKELHERYPSTLILAGNVVTPRQVEVLLEAGADMVKVGIGPGSVCTTRKLTGVGYPQLSAVLECADAARLAGGLICADGGITCPGDIAKAYAAGADYVMIGGLFAGHEEGLPENYKDKTEFVSNIHFYGMASKAAQTLHNGGVADYRASEGKEVTIKYRGPVENTVKEILGGLRSTCTYVGAEFVEELYHRTKFVRVSRQLNNVFGVG